VPSEQSRIEANRSGALLDDANNLVRAQPPAEHSGAAHAAEHRARRDADGGEPRLRAHRTQLAPVGIALV